MSETACTKSELDVFRPIDVQVGMTEGRWHTYYPLNSLNVEAGVFEFSIPGSANEVIDMDKISLYVRGLVKKDAATNAANDTELAPVNNFLHSMIRHIDVSINGQLITRASKDYAYKAYLEKLLLTDLPGGGLHDSQLLMEGFALDAAGANTTMVVGNNKNAGAEARWNLIKASRTFELRGSPAVDFFQSDRALLMGCDISIKIYLNDAKFYLADTNATAADRATDPVLQLKEMELHVRRVRVAPSFIQSIQLERQQKDAIYPFTRREMLTFNIGQNTTSVTKENLFRGQLATRFFVMMVDAAAYNGSITTSPFMFKPFNISEISMTENGVYMSCNPIKTDFAAKSRTVNAYHTLLESIGAVGERALSCPIDHARFCNGFTVFCFTRSPDLCHGYNHLPPQTASITLQMSFSAATTAALTTIIMAEYDSRIQITADNNVITDYAI